MIFVIGFHCTSKAEIIKFVTEKLEEAGIEVPQLEVKNGTCFFNLRYVRDEAKALKNYKYVTYNDLQIHFLYKDVGAKDCALLIEGLKDESYEKLDDFISDTWDILVVDRIVPCSNGYKALVYFKNPEGAEKCLKEFIDTNITVRRPTGAELMDAKLSIPEILKYVNLIPKGINFVAKAKEMFKNQYFVDPEQYIQ